VNYLEARDSEATDPMKKRIKLAFISLLSAIFASTGSAASTSNGTILNLTSFGAVVTRPARKLGTDPQRVVAVQGPLLLQGQTGTAVISLEAQGDENAVGLSLAFDPTVVAYTGTSLGPDAPNASININTNQVVSGHLGIILALATDVSFSPGTRLLLQVNFQTLTAASVNSPLALTDLPVKREVADTNAVPVASLYLDGTITVNPKPSLAIALSSQSISLAWPLWATNYNLQEAVGSDLPITSWTSLSVSPLITNNAAAVTLPLSGLVKFYRLQHQ
jgi:hypothetical protein